MKHQYTIQSMSTVTSKFKSNLISIFPQIFSQEEAFGLGGAQSLAQHFTGGKGIWQSSEDRSSA